MKKRHSDFKNKEIKKPQLFQAAIFIMLDNLNYKIIFPTRFPTFTIVIPLLFTVNSFLPSVVV